ncbi:hypothetical protein Flavo103_41600 [Flavobacterium collinsii]|uniref:hypothetical protein n=1 Tax=Flavobacterium collinsii TaxID=1114861 RepID=UPI0022C6BFB6|nr:hypothetical protein [Flavobacterium collinsii]GIQ61024.1 hypothetical protein Flavo103_41600 [Flavobacterium collinsii]
MPDKSFTFCRQILKVLAENKNKEMSLEKLTKIITSFPDQHMPYADLTAERENQTTILDLLIILDNEGLVTLNEKNDKSCITTKGIKIFSPSFY